MNFCILFQGCPKDSGHKCKGFKSLLPLLSMHPGLAIILSTSRQQLPLVVRKECTPEEDILKAVTFDFCCFRIEP